MDYAPLDLGELDRDRPILLASHGFSATPFEWQEFADFAAVHRIPVDRVTLGGHGLCLADFERSTPAQWAAPLLARYGVLVNAGFSRIVLACASLSAALVLYALAEPNGVFRRQPPAHVFFINPLIKAKDQLMPLTPWLAWLGGYYYVERTAIEHRYWYTHFPIVTLAKLQGLCAALQDQLRQGIVWENGPPITIFQSDADPTVDVGVVEPLVSQVHTESGVRVFLYPSHIHVLTRLAGREGVTETMRRNQLTVFETMLDTLRSA
jgi:carboxylesterase